MIDRRGILAGLLGMGVAPAMAAADAATLAGMARARGIRFGSTVGLGNFEDAAYRALNARECTQIVCENEMKWVALRPDARSYDFSKADRIVAWARGAGLELRGHTLLWHSERWMPEWTKSHDYGRDPGREAARIVLDHVRTVAGRYAPVVNSFDVVNEAVDPETGLLRETTLSKPLGAARVIDLAFRTARAAAPGVQLVYNDYMSWAADDGKHRDGVLRLLEGMKARGVPIDALGVQSHLGSKFSATPSGLGAVDERAWRRFLDEVTGMGLDLLVTEMDVHDNPLPGAIEIRDQAVADHTRRYLDLMLSYPQLRTIMCWGLSDKYSWLNGSRPRPDGLAKRPLPFDADFRPKPMREAIHAAMAGAAPRVPRGG